MFKTTQQQINGSLYQPQKLHHYCTEFPEQHRGSLVNLGDIENACLKKRLKNTSNTRTQWSITIAIMA